MLNFIEKLKESKASSDKKRQQDFDILKVKLEEKKLNVEWWKLAATTVIPLLGFLGVICQLNSQSKLKHEEFNFQKSLEAQKYESQLVLNGLSANDGNATLRKLVYAGFLNDSSRKYSFLIDDTIYMNRYTKMDQSNAVDSPYYLLSVWETTHTKPFCDYGQGSHFSFLGRADGCYKFIFAITSERNLNNFSPIITVSNGTDSVELNFNKLNIPPIKNGKVKTLVYQDCNEWISKNYMNRAIRVSSKWKYECE